MGLSKRHSAERNEETLKEVEGTVYDNRGASGRKFYMLSSGRAAHFENTQPHNPSTEDWFIPEDMEEGNYLMMNPACEVNEKGIREKNDVNEPLEEGTSQGWTWFLME